MRFRRNVALQQVSRPNKRKLITASKCAFFQQFVCVELGTFVSTFGGRRTAIRRVIFTLTNGSVYSIRTRVDRTVMRYRHHYNVIVKKTNLLSAERDGRWVLECVWGLQRHRSTSQRDARRWYDVECGSLFIDTDCRRDTVDVMLPVTCCCDWPPRRSWEDDDGTVTDDVAWHAGSTVLLQWIYTRLRRRARRHAQQRALH